MAFKFSFQKRSVPIFVSANPFPHALCSNISYGFFYIFKIFAKLTGENCIPLLKLHCTY